LAAVEIVVAIQAIAGGLALIGDQWSMDPLWLRHTPFVTWTGPGVLLIVVIALPHLMAAAAIVVRPVPVRLGMVGGLLAGVSLIIWIIMQIALLQVFFFLQPVVAVLGALEIGLAAWWRRALRSEDGAF
jgi:hypothetical protein